MPEGGDAVEFIAARHEDGKEDSEIRTELEAAAGQVQWREPSKPAADPPPKPAESQAGDARAYPIDPEKIHLTDIGNGKRLINTHGADLRFCSPWKKWLVWNDAHWRIDDAAKAEALAKSIVLDLFAWAQKQIDEIKQEGAGNDG